MTSKRCANSKAKKQIAGGAVDCGSLPPPRWSVLHMFYEHGDVFMQEGVCRKDLQIDKFLGSKEAEWVFKGSFQELLNEVRTGNCRAYVPPRFFRFEYYECDKWGRLVRDFFVLDSQSLAKVLCGATMTLVPDYGESGHYYFVLAENPKAYAEKQKFEKLIATIDKLCNVRKQLPPDSTTALRRLYLSQVYNGVVWEVVVAKGHNRSNLVAVERLPLYNLSYYPRLGKALNNSIRYLAEFSRDKRKRERHDAREVYKLAMEVAESLEAYFETRHIEHLYDALRMLHGVANKEYCDAACWYARVLLPGIREVVKKRS